MKNKNEYKKRDAEGNKLPEQIGKGFCKEHYEKVKKARENKDFTLAFRPLNDDYNSFIKFVEVNRLDKTEVLRQMFSAFMKDEIHPNKLDLIVRELTLKDEIINDFKEEVEELRQTNKELINELKKEIKK